MIIINTLRKKTPVRTNMFHLKKCFADKILNKNPFSLQKAPNCTYSCEEMMEIICYASLDEISISMASDIFREVKDSPSGRTVRYALEKKRPPEIDRMTNDYIVSTLSWLSRFSKYREKKSAGVAIDFHDDPYYGDEMDPYVVGGARKQSTNRFHRYATIYLCEKGHRFTLGMISVDKGTSNSEIVKKLMQQAERLVKIGEFVGDGTFYDVRTLSHLEKKNIHFIVRGHKKQGLKPLLENLEDQLVHEGDAKFIPYTMKSKRFKKNLQVRLLIYRQEGKLEILVVNKSSKLPAKKAIHNFKTRFGIDTSYKMKHMVKGWTCSKNPSIRSHLFAMSLILYNFWQLCRINAFGLQNKKNNPSSNESVRQDEPLRLKMLSRRLRLITDPLVILEVMCS